MAVIRHIIHPNSASSGVTPDLSEINYGEIAVNYNENTPFLAIKVRDENGNNPRIIKFLPDGYYIKGDDLKTVDGKSIVGNGDVEVGNSVFCTLLSDNKMYEVRYNEQTHSWMVTANEIPEEDREKSNKIYYDPTDGTIYTWNEEYEFYWSISTPSELQQKLTFDQTPSYGSTNPVTSNGIYNALSKFQGKVLVGMISSDEFYRAIPDSTATGGWDYESEPTPPVHNNLYLDVNDNNKLYLYYEDKGFILIGLTQSDIRLKDNIESISDEDIEKASGIELVSYTYKNDKSNRKRYGVIAQEMQDANLNELVSKTYNDYLDVDYVSMLCLKMRQLEKEIEELKEKVNS